MTENFESETLIRMTGLFLAKPKSGPAIKVQTYTEFEVFGPTEIAQRIFHKTEGTGHDVEKLGNRKYRIPALGNDEYIAISPDD